MKNAKTGWGVPPPPEKSGPKETWAKQWGWREYKSRRCASQTRTHMAKQGFEACVRVARVYARWPAPVAYVDHLLPEAASPPADVVPLTEAKP